MVITLEGKEYLLDIEQAERLGLLKEKDSRVKSWEEFKEKYINDNGYVYSERSNTSVLTKIPFYIADQLTPKEAKALAAFSKLLKLRRDWIGEWEPDWEDGHACKYSVICYGGRLSILERYDTSCALSFPTEQMAQEFLETFRDLIEEAKTLI